MPTGAGKSAGRVSVRVVPDTLKFRADLKASLDKIEAGLEIQVKAQLDDTHLKASLERLKHTTVDIRASINSKVASLELARVARNRDAVIFPKINKAALAGAAATLSRLSGGRVLGDAAKSLGSSLANLDRSLPKLAAVSFGVANIGAVALSSTAGLVTLGGSLAALSGLSVALPGLLAGAAVGAGTLALALADTGKQLGSLAPLFTRLQDSVSGAFWQQATAPIKDFVTSVLPSFRDGMTDVAKQLGGLTAALAGSLKSNLTDGVLSGMFANLSGSIAIAKQAVEPLVQAFVTLGSVGSAYLPRLATAFVNVSQQFSDFIGQAAADGSLTRWVDNGIGALKLLGSVVGSVGGILNGLFTAASNVGGGGLVSFAANLQAIADVVNSPGFQIGLTTILSGAQEALSGLGQAIGPIGGLFSSLAGTISGVFATAGQTVGSLLSGIASALSSPAFASGLTGLFAGLAAGVNAILPSLPLLASLMGSVGSFAGTLAATLGNVLGGALALVVPLVQSVLGALQPLIPVLGSGLVAVFQAIQGPLQQIVSQLLTGIVPVLTQLLPPLIAQLAPVLTQILTALLPLVPSIVQLVAAALPLVALFQGQIFQAISQVAQVLPVLVSAVQASLAVITAFVQTVSALFSGNFSAIPGIVTGAMAQVRSAVSAGLSAALALVNTFTGGALSRLVAFGSGIVSSISSAISSFVAKISSGISQAVSLIASLPGKAKSALGNLAGLFVSAGADMIRGLINGIGSMAGALAAAAANIARSALNAIKNVLGINSPSRVFRDEVGIQVARGFIVGVDSQRSNVDAALANMVALPRTSQVRAYGPILEAGPGSGAGAGAPSFTFGDVTNVSTAAIVAEVMQEIRRSQTINPAMNWG